MASFFFTLLKLLRAIRHASEDEEFLGLAFVTLTLLISGTMFYSYTEHWGYIDAFYFCVMTMTTIGYGDLAPSTDVSKIFTIFYAFISIGVFVSLAAKLATGMMHHSRNSGKKSGKKE